MMNVARKSLALEVSRTQAASKLHLTRRPSHTGAENFNEGGARPQKQKSTGQEGTRALSPAKY